MREQDGRRRKGRKYERPDRERGKNSKLENELTNRTQLKQGQDES